MNLPPVKRLWPAAVVRSVTATGTVNPVIVVQVGTYDSGPIIAIYTEFNLSGLAVNLDDAIDDEERRLFPTIQRALFGMSHRS
ncbi:MAG: hypothetical protein WAU82_17135 [Candidatus Binatus sp.]|uniref:hypothetical protein n=1 Tax=Candidatus Binatus sp. TaxID=2811406 RepID=UPI003BAFCAB8